jgi:hypothetical protein
MNNPLIAYQYHQHLYRQAQARGLVPPDRPKPSVNPDVRPTAAQSMYPRLPQDGDPVPTNRNKGIR